MTTRWVDLKAAKLSPEQELAVEKWVKARNVEWVEELRADLASARADNARLRALLGEVRTDLVQFWTTENTDRIEDALARINAELKENP